MSKQTYIVTGNIYGVKRGSTVDLTPEQAQSGIYQGRVRQADATVVDSPDVAVLKARIAELEHELEEKKRGKLEPATPGAAKK